MKSPTAGRTAWILTTVGLLFALLCLRFALNFKTSFPPSTDAGYYPMQTLFWFANGRLMYDDLPLLFGMNIALTWFLNVIGQPLEQAALLASRILDCVIPPFAAIPLMVTGYVWSEGRRKGLVSAGIAALLVTASPAILRLFSEFQKNSLGLVWMVAAIWACRSVMVEPTRRRWAMLGALLLLSVLTHIGAFGVTVLAVGLPLLIWCWQRRQGSLLLTLGESTVVLAVLLFVFDSRRALAVVRSPLNVFLTGPFQFPTLIFVIGALLIMALAIRRCRLDRDELPSSDMALVTGLAATLLILILPKNVEYFGRLALMATVPAAFLILFILARRAAGGRSSIPALLVLVLQTVSFIIQPPALQSPMMNDIAAAEFHQAKQELAARAMDPQKTLVVAPHGLDWWAGYFLGTPVRMVKPATLDPRYERLLLVRNIAPLEGIPGPDVPQPLGSTTRRLYQGQILEVYEVLQGHATSTEFWSGGVELAPGKLVTFRAELDLQSTPPIGYLWVGDERVPVPEISMKGNSLVLSFSEYGAEMRGTLQGKTWSGEYLRHRAEGTKSFKFSAIAVAGAFAPLETPPPLGSFTVKFDDEKEPQGQTSAKFWMNGDLAFGTFIAPDGDYGLLEGRSASKGRVEFHRFTGWQATRIDLTLTGNKWTGSFLAHSIDKPRGFTLEASAESVAARQTRMKDSESVFEFACASPTGEVVRNTHFKGKALIVDIMGTWCHNCLDSAPVLQQLQNRYGQRGLQVVGLSFEIRDDAKLAEKNLNLFKRRFGLTYPVLFCGDLSDSSVDRQLKSQLDNFFAYPTTLFVDRTGKVKTIHSGFKGPGTGNEFANEVAAFHELASELVPGNR